MEQTETAIVRTPLYAKHLEAGAKMVPFAGFEMPVQYTGVTDEHHLVRNACGMFDVSHMGEFFVRGAGALDLLQFITSNDVSKLVNGKVQYSCLPNGQGGIVDDLLVYRIAADHYMLVVNASNIKKDLAWINSHNRFECEVVNRSDEFALLAVQGPKAADALRSLTTIELNQLSYYTFTSGTFAGIENVIVSATGYTGAGGFELYIPAERAEEAWDAILTAGAEVGLKPAGLAARDTLRLEMGFCLYGNDINDTTSPIEAGLGWITKFTKPFIDRERLEKQKTEGVSRKLIGFEMIDRGIPRHGYSLCDTDGNDIGKVTSGTMSPTASKAIGMGYVQTAFAKPDQLIYITIRGKQLKAKVVKLPFI